MTPLSSKKGILGYQLAGLVSLLVSALTMICVEAAKSYPEALPGPVALFFMTCLSSAAIFALLSVKLVWLYDPEVHRRHFTMMALSLPLHYFFFTGILGAHVEGFMPAISWLAGLFFTLATAYAGTSVAALAVIYRNRIWPGRPRAK